MRKSNHQKLLHFLARPIIGYGSKTPHEKNNPLYLDTSSNRGRASDPHKEKSCTQNQIHSTTSSLKPHSNKTPILYFSRKLIFTEKFIQIKQVGSQSLQTRVMRISLSLTIKTQIQSTLNPSRQDQAWISQQSTKNSTSC